ncbi:hypothetical protein C0995_006576 [Termitomyces sp. Mi166|nr:hypothetical protein C0995_006576 [Termitomyces sp. Mi166\
MASSGPQDVEMRSPPSDAASSLRELALKSIKSRRKPHSESLLPPRPPPVEATFQLDYGQEEISPSRDPPQTQAASTPKLPAPKSPVVTPKPQVVPVSKPPAVSTPTPVPDVQAREEGEISDEEEAKPASEPLKPPSPLSHSASSIPRVPRHSTPSTSVQVPPDSSQSRLPLHERLSDPPVISDSPAFARNEESSPMQIDPAPGPALPGPGYFLDSDHIRPGVALNQDQYDKAKDIVLDLLGWGVDPEYLVDCGVTREVVYYVFTELNLRLPQNLDTTGLIPFTPEDALELQKSVMMPPPPPPIRARCLSQDPPSVSTNAPDTPSPPPATSPAGASTTLSRAIRSPRSISTSDLHDMEQQRRQELMARRAAIASKKSRNMPASTMSSPSGVSSSSASLPLNNSKQSHDMNVDSVEDFLKTIGPSSTPSTTTGSSAATTHQPNVDDMDVDEIPGLTSSYKTSTLASSSAPYIPSLVSPTESSHALLSPNQPPPSSTESGSTTYSSRSTETSTSSTETQLSEGPILQRRVFKRPVASDFVDFEESRPSNNNSRNGYRPTNGGLRRRPNGFASVVSQPRCIIDVSDSEGEGDGDVAMRDMETAWRSGFASPVPTKPFVGHLNTNGWATPPVSTTPTPTVTSVASTPTGTMSPAALLAKENEIQRMREIIAQKERKLKEAKALEASAKADVTVKREETPVFLPPDGGPSQQNGLATRTVDFQPSAQADRLESPVTSDTVSKSSAPVASTPSIGSLFRLPPLPTSD